MAFATVEDLQLLLRDEAVDEAQAQLLLDLATVRILAEIEQVLIAGEEAEIIEVVGVGSNVILLPQIPVTDVVEVTVAGTVLDADAYTFDAAGVLRRVDGGNWASGSSIAIEYAHGYENVPDIARLVCLQAAARAWMVGGPMTRETIGNYTAEYDASDSSGGMVELTKDEKNMLALLSARTGLA
jgi:hypothetical protein